MQPERKYDGIDGPRVAIAHDYLTQRGGAEKFALVLSRAFPDAPIYTLLYEPTNTYPEFGDHDIRVSQLNKIGAFRRNHRAALPVLPLAARSMSVDADVVVTSTSGWAHGFRTSGRKLVICHSPARWLYLQDMYLGGGGGLLKRAVLRATTPYLRQWDQRAASSCDRYIAVSSVIQRRIADAYGIDADVVLPPVGMLLHGDRVEPVGEVESWLGQANLSEAFYLCVSRLLPYKNVDAIIRAFAGTDRRLVVVGRGPEAGRLERIKTPNVVIVSDLSDGQVCWLYQHCRALIAASHEDYGLTPLEAAVWGRPSVVLRWGGFLDTVDEYVTGLYFDEPETGAIADALDRFESLAFDPDKIRRHVEQFTEERYAEALYSAVDDLATL